MCARALRQAAKIPQKKQKEASGADAAEELEESTASFL